MNKDKKFIKDKLQKEPAELPEALSGESIVSLIESENQEKAKKKNIIPFVLSAAAAIVVIAVGALIGTGVIGEKPEIKAPETTVSPEIIAKTAADYGEIADILSNVKTKYTYYDGFYLTDGAVAEYDGVYYNISESHNETATAAPAAEGYNGAEKSSSSASDDGDYSQLNTRTEGVDEEDIMKTDGNYIYVLKSPERGYYGYSGYYGYYFYDYVGVKENAGFTVFDKSLNKKGEVALTAGNSGDDVIRDRTYNGFFIYDNYVIFTGSQTEHSGKGIKYNEDEEYWDIIDPENVEVKTVSVISVYDMSDIGNIKPVKDFYFSGSLLSSRISGGRLVAVSSYYPNYRVFSAEDYTTFVPLSGEKDEYISPENITVLDNEEGNFTTVSVIDLKNGELKANSISLMGQAWELYCSGDNIYTYGSKSRYYENGGWVSVLCVNKVNISDEPKFVSSANIEHVDLNDTFSIDEYDGKLRLAVNEYSNSGSKSFCRVYVLNENMKIIGKTDSFAENEYVQSARFIGTTAYVVTFRNTDPLFVIDLSDPENPEITGELSLPGFSAYLHPVSDNCLVGIGSDGDDNGLNSGAKISLFDVSDPENPVEADNYTIADSRINSDYKAFVKKGENGYIVNVFDYKDKGRSGVLYFTVENGKIKAQNRVDLSDWNEYILKTVFIGDTLYFYTYSYTSERYRVVSYNLLTGEKLDSATV